MKRVSLGGVEMSRLVCGSNAFNARSHFSEARDAEYAARFDDEAAVGLVLDRALELGLDTYENSASDRAWEAVSRLRERSGRVVRFIGSTRIDETSPMRSHAQKLRFLIEHRAELCVIHAQHVERERPGDEIPGLERMLDEIHAAGLSAACRPTASRRSSAARGGATRLTAICFRSTRRASYIRGTTGERRLGSAAS